MIRSIKGAAIPDDTVDYLVDVVDMRPRHIGNVSVTNTVALEVFDTIEAASKFARQNDGPHMRIDVRPRTKVTPILWKTHPPIALPKVQP